MTTPTLSAQELIDIDKHHIWHPYSKAHSDLPIFHVASAQGAYLTLKDGQRLFDGMSSWWSTIHGYNHPTLNAAIQAQMSKMSHVMFGGLTHDPAILLAKQLVEISPQGLEHVFFSDSGSVSVEVALKMAVQYWNALGEQRSTFLTLKNGYHGDTFGAMSVCDPVTGMHQLFAGFLPQNIFVEAPVCGFDDEWNEDYLADFKQKIMANRDRIAAVILEPVVQGTGGMRFYSPHYLRRVREICSELKILLIADEIATGLGRSGRLFGCEHAAISPDIMCLGKALTGGYLSMAATLCNDHVATTVCQGEAGVFMHGPTFMANPLSCAVSLASIRLLLESNWQQRVSNIEQWFRTGLTPCQDHALVKDVRVLGAIGVVEMQDPVDMKIIQPLFVKHGIWLRPFGRLIYSMPPYIATESEIAFLCEKIFAVIEEYSKLTQQS